MQSNRNVKLCVMIRVYDFLRYDFKDTALACRCLKTRLLHSKCVRISDFAQHFIFVYFVYFGCYLLQNKTPPHNSILYMTYERVVRLVGVHIETV